MTGPTFRLVPAVFRICPDGDTIAAVDPSVAQGRDPKAMQRESLDQTRQRLGKELKDFPEAQAKLLTVLAKTYGALSLYTNAIEAAREALRLRQLTPGETNLAVADTLGYEVRNNVEDYSAGVSNDLAKITGAYVRGE